MTMRFMRVIAAAAVLAAQSLAAPTQASARQEGVTARTMTEIADISSRPIVSPDKKLVAFRVAKDSVVDNATAISWRIHNAEDRNLVSTFSAGNPIFFHGLLERGSAIWSLDSKWLIHKRLVDGEVQLWRTHRSGSQIEQITFEEGDVRALRPRRDGLEFTVGPSRAAFIRAEGEEFRRGLVIGGTSSLANGVFPREHLDGKLRRVRLSDELGWYETLLGPSEEHIRFLPYSSLVLNNPTKIAVRIGDRGMQNRDGIRAQIVQNEIATGLGIARLSDSRSDVKKLQWRGMGPSAEWFDCVHASCSRDDRMALIGFSEQTGEVIFLSHDINEGDGLYAWNPHGDSVRRIATTKGVFGVGGGQRSFPGARRGCGLTTRAVICEHAAATSPPKLVSIDLESGETTDFYDPNSELRQSSFPDVEYLTWADQYGRRASGVLVYPKQTETPFPLVITSYRCEGFLRGGNGLDVSEHLLAEAGIGALCVNYNLKQLLKVKPLGDTDGIETLQASLDLYEAGIDTLIDRGLVDGRRLGISGTSFGAGVVHWALHHSNRFVAAHSKGGEADFISVLYLPGLDENFMRRHWKSLFALPEPELDKEGRWDLYSPARNIEKVDTALLVQTGHSGAMSMLELYDGMRKAGKPMEIIAYEDVSHHFFHPAQKYNRYRRSTDWFRFWLQGYKDPDPEKEEQYSRWCKMRDERCASGEPEGEKPFYCEYSNAVH